MEIEVYLVEDNIGTAEPHASYESERVPEVGEKIRVDDGEGVMTYEVEGIINATNIDGDVSVLVTLGNI